MPAGREQIANTPLAGNEVRELILADTRRLVESHGLLSNHVAYGRIGYEVIVRLHLGAAQFDSSSVADVAKNDTSMKSAPIARNIVDGHEELRALETPPLAGASDDDTVVLGERVTRSIDSPNSERLRAGLPIPTMVRNQDGSYRTEYVQRAAQPDLGSGNVRMDDVTDEARSAWGLPPERMEQVLADAPQVQTEPAAPRESPEAERRRKLDSFFGPGTYDASKAVDDAESLPVPPTT